MRRRTFLLMAAGSTAGCSTSVDPPSPSPPTANLVQITAPALEPISPQRQQALIANAEGLTASELNATIPEIDVVEVDNAAGSAPPRDTLRLIAWNMERGRHWQDGAELVRTHAALRDPDVIFLGEMDHGMARSGNVHTTREMANALGMNYAYGVEFLELTRGEAEERKLYPGDNELGYHGNAILSRYPLEDAAILRFPGIEKWYGHFQQRLGGRMALLATVRVAGAPIALVSTHLESGQEAVDAQMRTEEAQLLAAAIRDYAGDKPVLFGGDLNTLAKTPPLLALEDTGLDFSSVNDYSMGTAQRLEDGKTTLRSYHIDYLAVRGAEVLASETSPTVILAALPAEPGGKFLGDHAIVTAEVRLTT